LQLEYPFRPLQLEQCGVKTALVREDLFKSLVKRLSSIDGTGTWRCVRRVFSERFAEGCGTVVTCWFCSSRNNLEQSKIRRNLLLSIELGQSWLTWVSVAECECITGLLLKGLGNYGQPLQGSRVSGVRRECLPPLTVRSKSSRNPGGNFSAGANNGVKGLVFLGSG